MFTGVTAYVAAGIGALVLTLASTIGVYHYVTVPKLQEQIAIAHADVATCNAQTTTANNTVRQLQSELDNQNTQVQALAGKAHEASVSADLAAVTVKPRKLPPAGDFAAFLAWVAGLYAPPAPGAAQ